MRRAIEVARYIESVNVSLHGYKYLGVKHNINLGSFAVIPDVLRFKHLRLFAPFRRHKCGIMLTRAFFCFIEVVWLTFTHAHAHVGK